MREQKDPNSTDVLRSKEKFQLSLNSNVAGKDADLIIWKKKKCKENKAQNCISHHEGVGSKLEWRL